MQMIEVSQNTHNRLREMMDEEETCELLIRRLLDQQPPSPSLEEMLNNFDGKTEHDFPGGSLPEHLHQTRLHRFQINGHDFGQINWNKAVRKILILLDESIDILSLSVPSLLIKDGKYDEQGYSYIHEIGKSVQGVNATNAAKIITTLADENDMGAELFFSWRPHKDALYPDSYGRIFIPSSKRENNSYMDYDVYGD